VAPYDTFASFRPSYGTALGEANQMNQINQINKMNQIDAVLAHGGVSVF
jgi:hypothetical protein